MTLGKSGEKIKRRAHPELNWRPADLQSAALPLSYTPDLLIDFSLVHGALSENDSPVYRKTFNERITHKFS